jgi:hypothetical protein
LKEVGVVRPITTRMITKICENIIDKVSLMSWPGGLNSLIWALPMLSGSLHYGRRLMRFAEVLRDEVANKAFPENCRGLRTVQSTI